MEFPQQTVSEALESAIITADHLSLKHSATVAAARQLAKRLDRLDKEGWVVDGKLDNVTVPTFLRYCEALGLTIEKPTARKSSAAPEPEAAPPAAGDDSREAKARRALGVIPGGKAG